MTKPSVPSSRSAGARRRGRPAPTRKDRRWIWAVALVGLMLLVALAVMLRVTSAPGEIAGIETFSNVPAGHQQGPQIYPQTPPAGGIHDPAWQNCGRYDQPIQNENAVHSLEHGAVWITYRPDLPAEAVEQLRALVRGRRFVLLSPYPDLPAPVVASAWGVQVKVDDAGDPRVGQFLVKYTLGPQAPEPGAPCTGGVGTPIAR